jgi:uncharacterized damage-inducible protein DinB
MDAQLIDRYLSDATELSKSIEGLSRDEMLAFPVPGTWSIQQIVLHLVDSDLVLADRMKRVIAEERPLLIGFDETKFASRLHYDSQDARLACEIFERNRQHMVGILKKLSSDAFERFGIHTERGKVTLADLLANAVNHLHHHLKFVRDKRRLLGKPLSA